MKPPVPRDAIYRFATDRARLHYSDSKICELAGIDKSCWSSQVNGNKPVTYNLLHRFYLRFGDELMVLAGVKAGYDHLQTDLYQRYKVVVSDLRKSIALIDLGDEATLQLNLNDVEGRVKEIESLFEAVISVSMKIAKPFVEVAGK